MTDIIKQEDSNATSKIHNCSYLHATEDARASVSGIKCPHKLPTFANADSKLNE